MTGVIHLLIRGGLLSNNKRMVKQMGKKFAHTMKSMSMYKDVTIAAGENLGPYTLDRLLQDDIRILGYTLDAWWSTTTHTYVEGVAEAVARFGLTSTPRVDGQLAEVSARAVYLTEIVVAEQIAAIFGTQREGEVVMFPSGAGIDLDKGDHLFLSLWADGRIVDSGNFNANCMAIIFYEER